jgi:hypothetical protein
MAFYSLPEDGCHGTTQGFVPGDAEGQAIEDRPFIH